MPFCVNCGGKHQDSSNFCNVCGRQVARESAPTYALASSNYDDAPTEYERGYWRIKRKENAAEGSNESAGMYVKCLALVGFLHGLAYMGLNNRGKPLWLDGGLGLILLAGVVFGALFKVIFDLRYGYSLRRSLFEVILFGALAYGGTFGVFWYLTENFLHTGKPLFDLSGMVPTPRPTIRP